MKIELLGFEGCPNTPRLRDSLMVAVALIDDKTLAVTEVNQAELSPDDKRRGFPAPTVLIDGKDLYGLPMPQSPTMCCRRYDGGLPTADELAAKLRAILSQ